MRPNSEKEGQAIHWLIWGGILVSLFFWVNLNDPFNAPKSWLLSIAGFWLLGWIAFQVKDLRKSKPLKWAIFFASIYFLAISASFIATDNKYIGMFGDYQRRTGYLSYVSLIIFFLAASFIFDLCQLSLFCNAILIVGALTGVYGLAQHFKHDFIQWNNPYNSVLSTLGNPDFAAALMAIFLVLNFGIAIQKQYVAWARGFAMFNVGLLFVVIKFSQVRQGILVAILGIAVIAIVWIYQRSKGSAYFVSGLAFFAGILAILGMLNKGPFSKYFYKISVTYRGDYWRAGWRMFIHNPYFGVGLDRYGANFRQYRDATQSLRRGPMLVSNAAHNVPIQLAATGGIFVLITFLTLSCFILCRGIIALRNSKGAEQITTTVIFAAWLSYEAQSLISIDNLGIAIWGYILGGAVVGISVANKPGRASPQKSTILQPLVSSTFALGLLTVSVLFFGSESAMKTLNSHQPPQSQSGIADYEVLAEKPLSFVFKEPTFAVTIAGDLAQVHDFRKAITNLQNIIAADPKNYDAKEILARIYEYQKNFHAAAEIRGSMVRLDPYNQSLKFQLASDEHSAQSPQTEGK